MIRGLLYTLRISPGLAFREAARRAFGISYRVNGVEVRDIATFKAVRLALSRGFRLSREGDLYVLDVGWGKFYAPSLGLFDTLFHEDFSQLYGGADVAGARVLDVGAYIGDTAVWFYRRGARLVDAYEPVFADLCNFNMEKNGLQPRCVDKALWGYATTLKVSIEAAGTGQRWGDFEGEAVAIGEVLGRYDVAKFDCEGCEWWLLQLPCDILRKVPNYIVEIHGPPLPLLDKFWGCGFRLIRTTMVERYVQVVTFRL